MGPIAIIAGVALAVTAAGTYMSIKAQQKQAKFQRQAARAQRAQDNLKAAVQRREAIRNARISSGQVLQSSVNQGVEGSSAAIGGLGSIDSQLDQGLSFLDGSNRLADQASDALGRANKAGANAQTWGEVAQFGEKVFNTATSGGFGK